MPHVALQPFCLLYTVISGTFYCSNNKITLHINNTRVSLVTLEGGPGSCGNHVGYPAPDVGSPT